MQEDRYVGRILGKGVPFFRGAYCWELRKEMMLVVLYKQRELQVLAS